MLVLPPPSLGQYALCPHRSCTFPSFRGSLQTCYAGLYGVSGSDLPMLSNCVKACVPIRSTVFLRSMVCEVASGGDEREGEVKHIVSALSSTSIPMSC